MFYHENKFSLVQMYYLIIQKFIANIFQYKELLNFKNFIKINNLMNHLFSF